MSVLEFFEMLGEGGIVALVILVVMAVVLGSVFL